MWVFFFLCASLYLLNDYYLLLVQPLSMGWPVVVLCCCHNLSGIVATPFSHCAVLVLWPSSTLNSCFAKVLACPFSVMAPCLYMEVYSFGAFTTLSMLAVLTCGAVRICLNHWIFFSLGWSVFSGRPQLSLLVCHFFRFCLVLWRSLGRFVPVYFLRRASHPLSAWGLELVAIGHLPDCCCALVWT